MLWTNRWVVLMLFAVVGCAGADMVAYEPISQKTKFRDDQLFGATERAIERLGYQPIQKDRDGGTVATREKEVDFSNHPRRYYAYSFKFEVSDGKVKIESTCKINSAMDREDLDDCGDERPQRVQDEQEQLYETILEIAVGLP